MPEGEICLFIFSPSGTAKKYSYVFTWVEVGEALDELGLFCLSDL